MSLFTGPRVEATGYVVAVLAVAFLLHGGHRVGVLVALVVYLIDLIDPHLFGWLSKFAEPSTWPGYVALGTAALFAGHAGGWPGVLVLVGLLVTGDGRMFEALY